MTQHFYAALFADLETRARAIVKDMRAGLNGLTCADIDDRYRSPSPTVKHIPPLLLSARRVTAARPYARPVHLITYVHDTPPHMGMILQCLPSCQHNCMPA